MASTRPANSRGVTIGIPRHGINDVRSSSFENNQPSLDLDVRNRLVRGGYTATRCLRDLSEKTEILLRDFALPCRDRT
jgi:hypothetical protein